MIARKIIPRFIALAAITLLLDQVYRYTFYGDDLREKSAEVVDIRTTRDSTDVYYFGESSNVTYAETDTVKAAISDLLGDYFPRLRVVNINKYATHAGIYRAWLDELEKGNRLPRAVVVTMNMRSFDAAWRHSKLETQLQESLVMAAPYPPIINRFLLSLQAFDNKTEQQREQDMLSEWRVTTLEFPFDFRYKTVAEWDAGMAQGGYLKPDGSWDMEKITLACHYIKSYAFNIKDDNPRTRDFDEIAAWAARTGVKIYFNLMAENVEYADSLVGKELVFLMRQNRDYLVNRYHRGNCRVVDNLEAVNGKDFVDQNWTTEHYNQTGRMIIARNLADTMRIDFDE